MNVANYFEIKSLLELTAARYSLYIRIDCQLDVEKIRKLMDITNDYSPEEEQQMNEENKWVEEDS